MSKKVLVISSSLRNNSNSDILADELIRGAKDAGHTVEKINLTGKTINFCKGCLACQSTHKCVINDDANSIDEKIKNADVIVFATPIYYYSVSGQLKTMMDRANPVYGTNYNFRDVYLLASAADSSSSAVNGAKAAIQGWVDCFGNASFKKTIFAGGVNDAGDVKGHPMLKEAYNTGKQL